MLNQVTKIPPFDMLIGDKNPYEGFGKVLPHSADLQNTLDVLASEAHDRVRRGFAVPLCDIAQIPHDIDQIIADMWNSGWNPASGDVSLFLRDFGLVLLNSVLMQSGGAIIFRSAQDITHTSVFWADEKLEVFPFHKVLKCLWSRRGESAASFVDSIVEKLRIRRV